MRVWTLSPSRRCAGRQQVVVGALVIGGIVGAVWLVRKRSADQRPAEDLYSVTSRPSDKGNSMTMSRLSAIVEMGD